MDWEFIWNKWFRGRTLYESGTSLFMLPFYKLKIVTPSTKYDGIKFYYPQGFPAQDGKWFIEQGMEYYDVLPSLKGDTAVDVGAGVGSYSLRFAKRFRKVIAFEPNPRINDYLVRNIYRNKARNVTSDCRAVSDTSGETILKLPGEGHESGATINPVHYPYVIFETQIPIRRVSLDDYFEHTDGQVDLVKIDAENHELSVLEGMKGIIKQEHPTLLVEVHQKSQTLTTCDCNVCRFLKSHYDNVELHSRQRPEWNAHWMIAQ